ncbi:MAG: ABC transporter ATP-binding protein [Ignisphaera sp.]|jgi:peptide/nickel transport system ATP-binding protein|nr:ABC transporter ATP-binding protein [Ignisphaera sp.]
MATVLKVEDLKVYYFTSQGTVKAVDGISFTIDEGDVLGVAGESGSGKSTLGYAILGLVPPPGKIVGGRIILDGIEITSLSEDELRKIRWSKVSMVFQGALNILNPVLRIGDQIAEILMHHKGLSKKEALEIAAQHLKLLGLSPDVLRRYPHELSGGMKQRVVIAMALLLKPRLVIVDEPTTALDVVIQAQIMNLLKQLKEQERVSMMFITHDLSLIAEIANKIAIMYAGKVVELGSADNIFERSLHPYTQGLIRSIPSLKHRRALTWIPGAPPDLRNPPPGCRFHPRCPYAMDVCKREEPLLIDVEKGHSVSCWLYIKK